MGAGLAGCSGVVGGVGLGVGGSFGAQPGVGGVLTVPSRGAEVEGMLVKGSEPGVDGGAIGSAGEVGKLELVVGRSKEVGEAG